jgi:Holliday junction resolvase
MPGDKPLLFISGSAGPAVERELAAALEEKGFDASFAVPMPARTAQDNLDLMAAADGVVWLVDANRWQRSRPPGLASR